MFSMFSRFVATLDTLRQKFPGVFMFLLHTSPYAFLIWKKINKFLYLENAKSLTPTERAQEKEQNELLHSCKNRIVIELQSL